MGTVESINTAAKRAEPTRDVERITVHPMRGPEGDRKFRPADDPNKPGDGRDLTLVEAEAVEGLAEDTGIVLEPRETRRNVVTRGIALNDLVGKRFRVGQVEAYGVELCEPCSHLESLTQPGVLRGLVHRGGLSADVISGGEIVVGDAVEALD